LKQDLAGRRAAAAVENIRLNNPQANIADIRTNVNEALKATGQTERGTDWGDTGAWLTSKMPWGKSEDQEQVDRLRNAIATNERFAGRARENAGLTSGGERSRQLNEAARLDAQNEKLLPVLERIEGLLANQAGANVNVQVHMPGAGEKPPQPAAAGLGGRNL